MNELNKILRLIFILFAIAFLYTWAITPKTDCQACKFSYEGDTINGYEAYTLYRNTCYELPDIQEEVRLAYNTTTKSIYVDIDNINYTEKNGQYNIVWNETTKKDG